MAGIRVTLESDVRERWTEFCRRTADGLRFAVRAACVEGIGVAKRDHKYKDREGTLTAGLDGRLETFDQDSATGVMESKAEHSSYVENGTRPHDIWPKAGHGEMGPLRGGQSRRAKDDIGTSRVALRWVGSDGETHFARVVHHPGSKPYPFLGPAYVKAEQVLERELGVRVQDAAKDLEK